MDCAVQAVDEFRLAGVDHRAERKFYSTNISYNLRLINWLRF